MSGIDRGGPKDRRLPSEDGCLTLWMSLPALRHTYTQPRDEVPNGFVDFYPVADALAPRAAAGLLA
jgi:hypothetical protein